MKEQRKLNSEQDYELIKHKLSLLEYHDHFSKDSISLVSKLLQDLINTTSSAKQFKVFLIDLNDSNDSFLIFHFQELQEHSNTKRSRIEASTEL